MPLWAQGFGRVSRSEPTTTHDVVSGGGGREVIWVAARPMGAVTGLGRATDLRVVTAVIELETVGDVTDDGLVHHSMGQATVVFTGFMPDDLPVAVD